jgi:GTP-binding protein
LRDYLTLRRELELYDPALAARVEIVVLNKIDLPSSRKKLPTLKKTFERRGLRLLGISAVTGEGISEVLEAAWGALVTARQHVAEAGQNPTTPDSH